MYEWRFLNYKEREVKREGRSVSQSDGYDKRFVGLVCLSRCDVEMFHKLSSNRLIL